MASYFLDFFQYPQVIDYLIENGRVLGWFKVGEIAKDVGLKEEEVKGFLDVLEYYGVVKSGAGKPDPQQVAMIKKDGGLIPRTHSEDSYIVNTTSDIYHQLCKLDSKLTRLGTNMLFQEEYGRSF